MTRQLIAATESALAVVQRTLVWSLLDRCLRGSVWVFPRLDWPQIERVAARLLEDLQALACCGTEGGEHYFVALVSFIACHFGNRNDNGLNSLVFSTGNFTSAIAFMFLLPRPTSERCVVLEALHWGDI